MTYKCIYKIVDKMKVGTCFLKNSKKYNFLEELDFQ